MGECDKLLWFAQCSCILALHDMMSHLNRLEAFQMNCLRFYVALPGEIKEAMTASGPFASCLALIRLLPIGGLDGLVIRHVCHRRLPYQCIFGHLSGTQAKCQPKDTWQLTVYKDLSALHVQYRWFRLST